MPLYEYSCADCRIKFEQICSFSAQDEVKCPKCQGKSVSKLISRFGVGGRGDLRESTISGCHDPSHSHSHSHSHVEPDHD